MTTTINDTRARVYVGTYAKYNAGNLTGAWLDLEDYADADAFVAACYELHKDEDDPELMFQDYEGFPAAYYGESHIKPELWAWLDLDEDDRELLAVYQEHVRDDADIDEAREHFMGNGYRDEADWAAEWLEESGGLEGVPKHLANYIDFEAYARDARLGGDVVFVMHGGCLWVFSNA